MSSTALTPKDLNWIVKIMYEDPEIVQRREMLSLALGITMSQLTDITRCKHTDSDTRVFLTQVLEIWISNSNESTFEKLVEVLREENFILTADEIVKKQLELPPLSAHDFEEVSPVSSSAIWYGVPDDVHMFTGRVDYMKELHESIVGQNSVNAINDMTVITAVCGMGGVGKTSLTIHYAWTFVKIFYVNVVWINSESVNTITNSFKRLARELGQDTSSGLHEVVQGIYKYFGLSKTLIVFDNVESYEDIKSYLPSRSPNLLRPFVLLSSRKREWHLRTHLIDLDLFTVEESVEFFKVYLNLKSEQELDFAKEISIGLQNLPLAIIQAGAYIKVQCRTRKTSLVIEMKSYMELFQRNSESILKFEHWAHTADIYEKTVYSTWTLNMTKLGKQNFLTKTIMEFISYLNSDNIPVKLLYNIERRGLLSRLTNPAIERSQVDSAVKLLSDFSLITNQTETDDGLDTICVHRLLQKVIRDQVQNEYIGSQFNWIIRWMEPSLRGNNYDYYEDMCLIHSLAVKEYIPLNVLEKKNAQSFVELISSKQSNSIDLRLELLKDMLRQEKYEEMLEFYEKSRTIYITKGPGVKNNTNDLFVTRFVNIVCLEVQREFNLGVNYESEKVLKLCQIIRDVLVGFHMSIYDEWIPDCGILQESAECLYKIVIHEDNFSLTSAKIVISTVYCILNILFEHLKNNGDSVEGGISHICRLMLRCLALARHGKELVEFMDKIERDLDELQKMDFYFNLGVPTGCAVLRVVNYMNPEERIDLIREAVHFYNASLRVDMLCKKDDNIFNIIDLLAQLGKGQEILEVIRHVEDLIHNNITTIRMHMINLGACIYNNSHHKNIAHFHDEMLGKSLDFYKGYINKDYLHMCSIKEANVTYLVDCSLVSKCAVGIIKCMVELNRSSEIIESLSETTYIFKEYCLRLGPRANGHHEFLVVIDLLFTTGMRSESGNIKNDLLEHVVCLLNIQYEFEKRSSSFADALLRVRRIIDIYLELGRIDDILNLSYDLKEKIMPNSYSSGVKVMGRLCEILLKTGRNSSHKIKYPALITGCLKISKEYHKQIVKDNVDKFTFLYCIATCEFLLEPNLDKLIEHSNHIFGTRVKYAENFGYLKVLAKVAVELRHAGQFGSALLYFEYLQRMYFARGYSLRFQSAGWTNDLHGLRGVICNDASFERAISVLPGVSLNESYDSDNSDTSLTLLTSE